MKVRAIKRGFYGGVYRRPKDEFDCSSKDFSKNWMEPAKVKSEKSKVEKPRESDGYVPLEIPAVSIYNSDNI